MNARMSAPVVPPAAEALSPSTAAAVPLSSAADWLASPVCAEGAAAKGSWKLARIRLTAACASPSASCHCTKAPTQNQLS